MLNIGSGSKVFLVAGPTDMRKSFDTLATVVRTAIEANLCLATFLFYAIASAIV